MILYPNAKVNIGLEVLRKRSDQFHDLETLFYPIQLSDILEVNRSNSFCFTQTGFHIDGDAEQNLVVKSFRLMQKTYQLPELNIHLHKQIPFGAGLGGGSSDAAAMISGVNKLFGLNIDLQVQMDLATTLGSDCPFFILNRPVIATGRGELFRDSILSLKGYVLALIKPNVSVSTIEAYAHIVPQLPDVALSERLNVSVSQWAGTIQNRFEDSVFVTYPAIKEIKEMMYRMGAVYASMSGSGSSVFGLFKQVPSDLSIKFPKCFVWTEECAV